MSQTEREQERKGNVDENSSTYGEDIYEHVSPGLIYIDTCCSGVGIDEELFYSRPKGCDCRFACEGASCACLKRSREASHHDASARWTQMYPVFECNSDCSCDPICTNRITQKGPRCGLKVIPVGKKGLGVVTEKEIPEGDFVCEYAGEVIGEEEARRRLGSLCPTDANYILVIREHIAHTKQDVKTQTTIIDPTVLGNIGRYFNHSCDPNIRVVPIRSQSFVPIAALFTTRPIRAGEELCYDYDSSASSSSSPTHSVDEDESRQTVCHSSKPCDCGSSNCRGFLPSNPSLF